MRNELILCDVCGHDKASRFSVKTGKFTPCPAGGHSEPDYFDCDLCDGCSRELLLRLIIEFVKQGIDEGGMSATVITALRGMGLKR